jgi:putative salt-induced outer membrane protein
MHGTTRAFPTLAILTAAAFSAAAAQPAPPATSGTTAFTADLGVISASGNTRLQTLSIGEKVTHTRARWVLQQMAAYVYGETDTSISANQLRASLRSDYVFHPRVSTYASASFERNTFAGFTRRTDEGAGFSWKALQLASDSLSIDAGGVLTQQSDVDGTSKSFPAARLAGAFKHAFTAAAYFQQLAEYVPDLETSGAYRVNSESSVVAPLSSHLGIKMAYVLRYDSRPPIGFGTTDRVFTSGIQVTF